MINTPNLLPDERIDEVNENIRLIQKKDGLTFVLHDNVWGTNFPLWYEDNARFGFEIKLK